MARAVWNGTVVADSDETILVEGNHYFPPDSVKGEYLTDNPDHTVCSWKGVASYYDVTVDGEVSHGGAWYYPDPSPAAADIMGYVAFWRGIRVEQ